MPNGQIHQPAGLNLFDRLISFLEGGVEQDPEQAQRQTFDLLTGGLPNRPLPISPTPVQPEPTQQLTAPGVPQEPAQPQLLQRLGSMGLSFLPAIGEAKDLTEAITGEDPVTGERLTGLERALSGIAAFVPFVGGAFLRHVSGDLMNRVLGSLRRLGDAPRSTISDIEAEVPTMVREVLDRFSALDTPLSESPTLDHFLAALENTNFAHMQRPFRATERTTPGEGVSQWLLQHLHLPERVEFASAISGWIQDSTHLDALRLQIAARELGLAGGAVRELKRRAPNNFQFTIDLIKENPEKYDDLKRAMLKRYLVTQKALQDQGIDRVVLYRGVDLPQTTTRYLHNPMESWTEVPDTTSMFGDVILRMEVPAERIYDSWRTGRFQPGEYEYIVLNRDPIFKGFFYDPRLAGQELELQARVQAPNDYSRKRLRWAIRSGDVNISRFVEDHVRRVAGWSRLTDEETADIFSDRRFMDYITRISVRNSGARFVRELEPWDIPLDEFLRGVDEYGLPKVTKPSVIYPRVYDERWPMLEPRLRSLFPGSDVSPLIGHPVPNDVVKVARKVNSALSQRKPNEYTVALLHRGQSRYTDLHRPVFSSGDLDNLLKMILLYLRSQSVNLMGDTISGLLVARTPYGSNVTAQELARLLLLEYARTTR